MKNDCFRIIQNPFVIPCSHFIESAFCRRSHDVSSWIFLAHDRWALPAFLAFDILLFKMRSNTKSVRESTSANKGWLGDVMGTHNGHPKVPHAPHAKWVMYVKQIIDALGWTSDQAAEEVTAHLQAARLTKPGGVTSISGEWVRKKAFAGKGLNGKYLKAFERGLKMAWTADFPTEPPLQFPPRGAWREKQMPTYAQQESIDEELISSNLTAVAYAQWLGTKDDWSKTIENTRDWLKNHPEDIYCRAMLFWAVLIRGNLADMVEMLEEISRWLDSEWPPPSKTKGSGDSEAWRAKLQEEISKVENGASKHANFVRWHLEDTLVRAAMLRWLRFQGMTSRLRSELKHVGHDLQHQQVLKKLLSPHSSQSGDDWVSAAVELAQKWAGYELESGLARLCSLWFTGRQFEIGHEDPKLIKRAVKEISSWLKQNPDHSLVRWATIWLAGHVRVGNFMTRLIDESADWLDTKAGTEDRLVRMGFLWLVGANGNSEQIQRVNVQTSQWLKAHREDDFIRVAYILFLIRRKGTDQCRRQVIANTRRWLRNHPDPYEITTLALRLCEPAPC